MCSPMGTELRFADGWHVLAPVSNAGYGQGHTGTGVWREDDRSEFDGAYAFGIP